MRTRNAFGIGTAVIAAVLLAGCAAGEAPSKNPACKDKWETVLNLARCVMDIEPPRTQAAPADG